MRKLWEKQNGAVVQCEIFGTWYENFALGAKISHLVQNFALVRNFQRTIFFFCNIYFFENFALVHLCKFNLFIYLFFRRQFFFGIYIFKYINKRKVFLFNKIAY